MTRYLLVCALLQLVIFGGFLILNILVDITLFQNTLIAIPVGVLQGICWVELARKMGVS